MTVSYYVGMRMLYYVFAVIKDAAFYCAIVFARKMAVSAYAQDGIPYAVQPTYSMLRLPMIFYKVSIVMNLINIVMCLADPAAVFNSYVSSFR